MRILVAPDSFKGSLTAGEAAEAIREGILAVIPAAEVVCLPMADGGEGTVEVLIQNRGGSFFEQIVRGPLGDPVTAQYGVLADGITGVMEMASASGLTLIPEEHRNPLLTSTHGTGELIKALLDQGCRKMIIGIGGSATNDAGAGMAQALGIRFLDDRGEEVTPVGGNLSTITSICMDQRDPRLDQTEIWIACDVTNPLLGPQGASYVYAPQKGADGVMVMELERNVSHFNEVIHRYLGVDGADEPGAGAAGGLGVGLMVFAGGRFLSGVDLIMDLLQFDDVLEKSHYVCTGEGRVDLQTLQGKVVSGIVRKTSERNIPVFVFAGELMGESQWNHQDLIFPFCIAEGPAARDDMMKQASSLLTRSASRIFKVVRELGGRMKQDE